MLPSTTSNFTILLSIVATFFGLVDHLEPFEQITLKLKVK